MGPPCTQCLMFLLLDRANLHLLAYQGPVPPPGRALPGRQRGEPGSPWGPGDAGPRRLWNGPVVLAWWGCTVG